MNNIDRRVDRRAELRAQLEARRDRAFRTAPGWRTRRRRRGLVVLLGLTLAAAATAAATTMPGEIAVVLAGVVVSCAVGVGLRVLTRGVAESVDAQLDERDHALRDSAFRWSYLIAVSAVVAVAVFVALAAQQPDLGRRVVAVLTVLTVGLIMTPTAVLAWLLPSDDPDDLR